MLANGTKRESLVLPCGANPYEQRVVGIGEMAEWLNAAVLKTADGAEPFVGSNPTLS